jgi:predicted phage-related endonuclease
MLAAELEVADIAVLIGSRDFRIYEIPADRELQEMILDGEARFWDMVKAGTPPQPDYEAPSTARLIRSLYPGTDGTKLVATSEQEGWRVVMEDAAEKAATYGKTAEGAKLHLLWEMKNAAQLVFSDGKALRRKLVTRKGYTVEPSEHVDARFVNAKE